MLLFSQLLPDLDQGEIDVAITEKLQSVAAAVKRTGKPGAVTIQLKIVPAGEGRVMLQEATKIVKPELPHADSLFFVRDDGNLSRANPYQSEFDLAREEK
jgi:hypothetical protein